MKTNQINAAISRLPEFLVVAAICSLLLAIGYGPYSRHLIVVQKKVCIENLKHIDCAKMAWQFKMKPKNGSAPTAADLFGSAKYMPVCPAGGAYTIGRVGELPRCSLEYNLGHTLAIQTLTTKK